MHAEAIELVVAATASDASCSRTTVATARSTSAAVMTAPFASGEPIAPPSATVCCCTVDTRRRATTAAVRVASVAAAV